MAKKKKKKNSKSYVVAGILLAIILIAAIAFTYSNAHNKKNGPIKISITEITAQDCTDCLNISAISQGFFSQEGVELSSKRTLEYTSFEAQELIKEYNLKRIPALLVYSPRITEMPSNEILEITEETGVFEKAVPYLDLETEMIKGVVQITELASTCNDICPKVEQVRIQLEENFGVTVSPKREVTESSLEGQSLIKELGITFTPAILVSKNIEEYWWVFPVIEEAFIPVGE